MTGTVTIPLEEYERLKKLSDNFDKELKATRERLQKDNEVFIRKIRREEEASKGNIIYPYSANVLYLMDVIKRYNSEIWFGKEIVFKLPYPNAI